MTLARIGFVQFAPRLGEQRWNRRRAAELIGQAPAADLLVLPELCVSGYNFETWEQAWALSEPATPQAETVRMLHTMARDHRVTLVSGFCEREEVGPSQRLYNSAVVVTPDGLQGVYRKVHLFNTEKSFFEPGDRFPVFDLPLREGGTAKLGVLVCFDWHFPETWRLLKLAGADIVAHPSNLVLPGKCQRALPAFAMVNRMAIAMCNRYGEERGVTFTGESMLLGPDGEELARSPASADDVQTALIDLDRVRNPQVTPRNHLLADRRPELYEKLAEPDR